MRILKIGRTKCWRKKKEQIWQEKMMNSQEDNIELIHASFGYKGSIAKLNDEL